MVDKRSRIPFYIQIYEIVLDEIKNKKYDKGDFLPSEKEFSEIFSVERQTVRRALELLVNEGLVEKKQGKGTFVKDYQSPISTPLRSPKNTDDTNTKRLSFLLPEAIHGIDRIAEPFKAQLFTALGSECREYGHLLSFSVPDSAETVRIIAEQSDGLFLISVHPPEIYDAVKELNIPAISIHQEPEHMVCLLEDSLNGVYQAVMYLIQRGHRDIAMINGPEEYNTAMQRQMGWIKALDESNINYRELPYERGDWSFNGGMESMSRILARSKPSALIAANDMMAYGAIESASSFGIKVPRDMSVIGFDNIDQCNYMNPHLTSVSPDIQLMAHLAFIHIMMEISTEDSRGYKVIVPTTLVERDTVRDLRMD